MQALATSALAVLKAAEPWTGWNRFGGIVLLIAVVGLAVYRVSVTLR